MTFQQPNVPANINYSSSSSSNSTSDINNNQVQPYDVVIIGAGLSGLYAANVLKENGVNNFVVLEARDRVGGRTFTKKDSNVGYVDLGASYVGPSQFYMQRLIKKFGLKTFKVNTKGRNVYLNERRRYLHACDTLPAMGSLVEMEVNYVLGLIDQMCNEIPLDKPWLAPNATEWDRITFGAFLEKHCWTKEARDFVALFMGCCTSCETYESSLLWTLWFTRQCDGLDVMFNIEDAAQDSKIVGGTLQISERLHEAITQEDKENGGDDEHVQLNKPVVHIQYEGESAQHNDEALVKVTTLDGCEYLTRYIIMAIPISLQQKIHYSPSLPPLYQQLMQKMPMGSVIKCVVYYKEPFWRRDQLTGSMIINLPGEEGPISYTLDDTKPDGTYPAIVGFIIGDRAVSMLKKTREERLRIICDSYAKALGSDKALSPIHYEEKNWMSEQYTGGCFTAFGIPGFMTNYGELLHKPLMMDRIHLAGTETATYWSGYMDGALQSGEHAAIQIMQRLKIKVRPETILESTTNRELVKRKQSLQELVRERRDSNSNGGLVGGVSNMKLAISISQLITWSGIFIALMGIILTASF